MGGTHGPPDGLWTYTFRGGGSVGGAHGPLRGLWTYEFGGGGVPWVGRTALHGAPGIRILAASGLRERDARPPRWPLVVQIRRLKGSVGGTHGSQRGV